MFDPRTDPFYKPDDPNQVETVPVENMPGLPTYNYPLCDDVINDGTATPTNPVLCRENRPKPWETGGNLGLGYMSPCPPNYQQWGGWTIWDGRMFTDWSKNATTVPYSRCVLAIGGNRASGVSSENDFTRLAINSELAGEYLHRDTPDGRGNFTSYAGHSILEKTSATRWDSTPEKFYEDLGLRAFVNNLNEYRTSKPSVSSWASDWDPTIINSGRPMDGITVPSALTDGVDYNPNNPTADPDFQWIQYDQNGGERPRITQKYLGDFAVPYTDVGVSWRGGQALSDRDRMKKLYPDMTDMEYDSAITNANAEAIAEKQNFVSSAFNMNMQIGSLLNKN
ncbi:MAG: hypothetical protein EB127_20910 [Alphaproteobacteria bacterium]|nr:hypothetical protein [Alphaproteobacteria bacterium]